MKYKVFFLSVLFASLAIPNSAKAYDFSYTYQGKTLFYNIVNEPTLKSKACLKCLYFTIIIFDLCRYLEYFSYLCTINQTE